MLNSWLLAKVWLRIWMLFLGRHQLELINKSSQIKWLWLTPILHLLSMKNWKMIICNIIGKISKAQLLANMKIKVSWNLLQNIKKSLMGRLSIVKLSKILRRVMRKLFLIMDWVKRILNRTIQKLRTRTIENNDLTLIFN